jgi:hypothetical protein
MSRNFSHGPKPLVIEVSARQQALLEEISRIRQWEHGDGVQARIILQAADSSRYQAIGQASGVSWRRLIKRDHKNYENIVQGDAIFSAAGVVRG